MFSQRNEIEATGSTVSEAIEDGLKKLKIEKEDAEIKILDEGRSGLFGLMGSSPAKIKISARSNVAMTEKNPEVSEVVATDYLDVSKRAEEIVKKIIELLDFDADVSTEASPNSVTVNVSCDDGAILIGRQGQTIQAFEYILKLSIGRQENRGVRITLNINDYLEKVNERTVRKARELEEQVKMKCEPVEIKLPANERRIIHLTLQDSEFVETLSEGEGEDRKLIVRPKS